MKLRSEFLNLFYKYKHAFEVKFSNNEKTMWDYLNFDYKFFGYVPKQKFVSQ